MMQNWILTGTNKALAWETISSELMDPCEVVLFFKLYMLMSLRDKMSSRSSTK